MSTEIIKTAPLPDWRHCRFGKVKDWLDLIVKGRRRYVVAAAAMALVITAGFCFPWPANKRRAVSNRQG